LVFISRADGSEIATTIIGLHYFPTFAQLFATEPVEKFGGEIHEELLREVEQYYSLGEQLKYVVVGIEFSVL